MKMPGRRLHRDLWRLRGQMLSIALAVACGVATVVSLGSTYASIEAAGERFYREHRFADVFVSLARAPESLRSRIEAIPGVAAVEGRVVQEVTLDVPGLEEPATGRLISLPEHSTPRLNVPYLRRGRPLAPGARDEVLLGERFAEVNGLGIGDTLGAVINGRRERLRIVGIVLSPEYVLEATREQIFMDNRRFGVLWMSHAALGAAYGMEHAFNDLALALAPRAREAAVIAEVDRVLASYGGLGAYGRSEQGSHRILVNQLDHSRVSCTLVPALFLAIAAFLLHMVLSRLVGTQRTEIGVLKALGYTNLQVGRHYLYFAAVAVLLGVGLGTLLGSWLGDWFTQIYSAAFFRFPQVQHRTSVELVMAAVLVSALAAALGTLSAVHRAVRLPPAEAMRPEPPAHYRPGWLEQAGLGTLLPPAGRMMIRNLERRPVRSLLTALGVALSVAIVIVSTFTVDAVEFMADLQFRHAQREDLRVAFATPRPASVRQELARLEGVKWVETTRLVRARLLADQRDRRIVLVGLEPEAKLQRLVNRRYRPLPVPPEGVVLTDALAQALGVMAGDTLTLEILEGTRPTRRVPVAGTVDELFGTGAYMDLHALGKLLREDGLASSAQLVVEPQHASAVYRHLKRMPTVAGITSRAGMLASFREEVGGILIFLRRFLIAFACAMALAVITNGAWIALAEREPELASLQALGFSARELAVLLLGEQAVLTAAGIPLGYVIGHALSAMVAAAFSSEITRIPLVIDSRTYLFAAGVAATAALLAGAVIRRRLDRLDLLGVLKVQQ